MVDIANGVVQTHWHVMTGSLLVHVVNQLGGTISREVIEIRRISHTIM